MKFLSCLRYILTLCVASFVTGRLLPKNWFHADHFPWRCDPSEQRLWKVLRVKQWQNKVPDMSRLFPHLMPPKKITEETINDLPRMIAETCVAEWTHIALSFAGLAMLRIWPGIGGITITLLYVSLGNLPFIIIQRYNRPRLQKLLAMQQRKLRDGVLPSACHGSSQMAYGN